MNFIWKRNRSYVFPFEVEMMNQSEALQIIFRVLGEGGYVSKGKVVKYGGKKEATR